MPIFLKLQGIQGNIEEPTHGGWIGCTSFAWRGYRTIASPKNTSKDREKSDCTFGRVQLKKGYDLASHDIADHFFKNTAFQGDTTELDFVRTGDAAGLLLTRKWTLTSVIIASLDVDSDDSGNIVESISLDYTMVQVRDYTSTTLNDLGTPSTCGFNLAKGGPI